MLHFSEQALILRKETAFPQRETAAGAELIPAAVSIHFVSSSSA